MSDFVEVSSAEEEHPRWFRVLSISGKDLGLGFECPVCHHGFSHHAPSEIEHCRRVEKRPFFTAHLPTKQIGGAKPLPRNIQPIGW
jgi:hypothetical protein